MIKVAISEFRAQMPKYLSQVSKGNTILLTSHGQEISEIKQPVNHQESAKTQLAQIAKSAKIGDITSPVVEDFEVSR